MSDPDGILPLCPPPTDEERAAIGAAMGLDEAEVATLVATGNVEGLGAIVCVQCQDSAEEAE